MRFIVVRRRIGGRGGGGGGGGRASLVEQKLLAAFPLLDLFLAALEGQLLALGLGEKNRLLSGGAIEDGVVVGSLH